MYLDESRAAINANKTKILYFCTFGNARLYIEIEPLLSTPCIPPNGNRHNDGKARDNSGDGKDDGGEPPRAVPPDDAIAAEPTEKRCSEP